MSHDDNWPRLSSTFMEEFRRTMQMQEELNTPLDILRQTCPQPPVSFSDFLDGQISDKVLAENTPTVMTQTISAAWDPEYMVSGAPITRAMVRQLLRKMEDTSRDIMIIGPGRSVVRDWHRGSPIIDLAVS